MWTMKKLTLMAIKKKEEERNQKLVDITTMKIINFTSTLCKFKNTNFI